MRLTNYLSFLLPVLSQATFPVVNEGDSLSARTIMNAPAETWPRKTLILCTEGGPNEHFVNLVQEAWNLWRNVIGGETRSGLKILFPYNRQDSTMGGCESDPETAFMHVTINTQSKASTTIGYQGKGRDSKGRPLNRMNIDITNTNYGRGTILATLAHELGHAFGLRHEHQRWDAWGYKPAIGKRVAPLLKLNCENLDDYAKFAADKNNDMTKLCSEIKAAKKAGFSASQFLPHKKSSVQVVGAFDWSSIMLYSSTDGARLDENFHFTRALQTADGNDLGYNTVPSAQDGYGITLMYPPNQH